MALALARRPRVTKRAFCSGAEAFLEGGLGASGARGMGDRRRRQQEL